MQDLIYKLGCERANDIEIKKSRLYFNLGEIQDKSLIESAMDEIKKRLTVNLYDFRHEIIERNNA